MIQRLLLLLVTAAATLVAAPPARAQCAGYTDVSSASAFCANVQWIRNRGITQGCTATAYCPNDAVSRLAMAAFLNRLGTALTPVQLAVDVAPGAIDLDAPNPANVVCQTPNYAVTDFPRRAFVDVAFSASAAADADFAADLVATTDNGATWAPLNAIFTNRGGVPAGRWGAIAGVGLRDLDVGQTVRFGLRVARDGLPGTADLVQSRCQLRTLIYSRNGASAPF